MLKTFIFTFLLLFSFFLSYVYPQTINEEFIVNLRGVSGVSPYTIKYDSRTRAFICEYFEQGGVYTKSGATRKYDFAITDKALFDSAGNVYSYTYNRITDSTRKYFLIKNRDVIAEFDYIFDGWVMRDGIIYFAADKKGKSIFFGYNTSTGKFLKGKPYDKIYMFFCPVKGSAIWQVGFTRSGKPYYLASEGDEEFVVIGGEEQKHYKEIYDRYSLEDSTGDLVYVACSCGSIYSPNKCTFIVQGKTEYNKYGIILTEPVLSRENLPVYVATSDSAGKRFSKVVSGNNVLKVYTDNVELLQITPGGKIAYVVSSYAKNEKSFLVIDGIEIEKYDFINSLMFGESDIPFYSARNKENCLVVNGSQTINTGYNNIESMGFLSGGMPFFIGTIYPDLANNIPGKKYIHIGEEKFGPYVFLMPSENKYILDDDSGNYAYIAWKFTDSNETVSEMKVYSNKGVSRSFIYIDYFDIYNGRIIFTGRTLIKEKKKRILCRVYVDNNPLDLEYEATVQEKFDSQTGTFSFIGLRDSSLYWVEVKF